MPKVYVELSYKYVNTIEDFVKVICPRKNQLEMQQVIEYIKQGKLSYGNLQNCAKELNIPQATFNYLIRRLKALGIITKSWTFSSIFQEKLTSLSMFYGDYTDKRNETAKALADANEYIKSKGFGVTFLPLKKEAEQC